MRLSFTKKNLLGFCLAIVLVASLAFISYNAIYKLVAADKWVVHTQSVIQKALTISSKLTLADDKQRSYLIRNKKEELHGYYALVEGILLDINGLRDWVGDNSSQRSKIDSLHKYTIDYFSQFDHVNTIERTGSLNQHKLFILNSSSRDACLSQIQKIIREEQRLLSIRELASKERALNAEVLIVSNAILGILCIVTLAYFVQSTFKARSLAREKLKLSESLFHNSFNHASVGKALVSPQGEWLKVNPALCNILGYSKDELLKLTFQDITHPEDHQLDVHLLKGTLGGEIDTFVVEKRYIHKQGHHIWIQLNVTLVRENGVPKFFISEIIDITPAKSLIADLKAKNEAIKHKEEQLTSFIEHSPAAICMLDMQMNFIAASKFWTESYLKPGQIFIGKNVYELFPHLDNKWKMLHERALAGEVISSSEELYITPEGKEEWVNFEFRPWYQHTDVIGGIILFAENITEQKQAKEELIRAKEEAEQAAIAKTNFLSTMSHEIRTPMNAVIGFTHLLLQNAREDQMEYLKMLKFSGENLLVLINDILDYNKIEAGKIQFESIDFNLRELIQNIKGGLLEKAKDKGIELKVLMDDELPEMVKGDSVRLTQVLVNLLSNAVKFTERGRVTISASISDTTSTHTMVNFAVRDTGIGIAKDKQEFIFESFTQASADTTRKYGGTGLGLAISKRLLELQNSKIFLESDLGRGSCFHFELAFKKSKIQKSGDGLKFSPEKRSLKGVHVLLAEDNRINVVLAKQFLKQWEIEYDVAENGKIALEMVQLKPYHLVLMDLQMPEMDGYTATIEIRKLEGERYQKLPIIALTASAMNEIRESVLNIGMNDSVTKPFNPDELYSKIDHYKSCLSAV